MGGGVNGNGPHRVKLISQKTIIGSDYHTREKRPEVEYLFEENGVEKRYSVPVKNKEGRLNYFIKNMAEVEEGEEIILEMKRVMGNSGKYINVINFSRPVAEGIDEEIEESEEENEKEENEEDEEKPEEEINVKDIPF